MLAYCVLTAYLLTYQVSEGGVEVVVAAVAVAMLPLVHQPPREPVAVVAVKGLVRVRVRVRVRVNPGWLAS